MTPRIDKRIVNASIEFKDQSIDNIAILAIVECLEAITDEFSVNSDVPPSQKHEKGKYDNGDT